MAGVPITMDGIPIPPPPGTDLSADRYPEIAVAATVCFFFVNVAVTLRFLSRKWSGAGFWIDDYLVIPAWFCELGHFIVQVTYHNWGKHVWAVGLEAQLHQIQMLFAMEFFYLIGLSIMKTSVLAFYYRIFRVSAMRYLIYIMLFMVMGWFLAMLVMCFLQCVPLNKLWNIFEPGYCNLSPGYLFGSAFVHIVLDAFLLLMPIPFVLRLQATRSQKTLLIGTFTMGGFVIAISCLRLYYVWNVNLNSIDETWNLTDTILWSVVEMQLALVAICLPTLRPFYRWLRTGSFGQKPSNNVSEEERDSSDGGSQSQRSNKWLAQFRSPKRGGEISMIERGNDSVDFDSKVPKATNTEKHSLE